MDETVDLFESITTESKVDDDFVELTKRPTLASTLVTDPQLGVVVARFVGVDLQEQPLIADLTCLPGQVVQARSTVALQSKMTDAQVVVMFEEVS